MENFPIVYNGKTYYVTPALISRTSIKFRELYNQTNASNMQISVSANYSDLAMQHFLDLSQGKQASIHNDQMKDISNIAFLFKAQNIYNSAMRIVTQKIDPTFRANGAGQAVYEPRKPGSTAASSSEFNTMQPISQPFNTPPMAQAPPVQATIVPPPPQQQQAAPVISAVVPPPAPIAAPVPLQPLPTDNNTGFNQNNNYENNGFGQNNDYGNNNGGFGNNGYDNNNGFGQNNDYGNNNYDNNNGFGNNAYDNNGTFGNNDNSGAFGNNNYGYDQNQNQNQGVTQDGYGGYDQNQSNNYDNNNEGNGIWGDNDNQWGNNDNNNDGQQQPTQQQPEQQPPAQTQQSSSSTSQAAAPSSGGSGAGASLVTGEALMKHWSETPVVYELKREKKFMKLPRYSQILGTSVIATGKTRTQSIVIANGLDAHFEKMDQADGDVQRLNYMNTIRSEGKSHTLRYFRDPDSEYMTMHVMFKIDNDNLMMTGLKNAPKDEPMFGSKKVVGYKRECTLWLQNGKVAMVITKVGKGQWQIKNHLDTTNVFALAVALSAIVGPHSMAPETGRPV